jgi:hypothetical protein
MNNKQVDSFYSMSYYKYLNIYRLYQLHADQVCNVLIAKLKRQHYGDEIVKVNLFVMHVGYIINFIK